MCPAMRTARLSVDYPCQRRNPVRAHLRFDAGLESTGPVATVCWKVRKGERHDLRACGHACSSDHQDRGAQGRAPDYGCSIRGSATRGSARLIAGPCAARTLREWLVRISVDSPKRPVQHFHLQGPPGAVSSSIGPARRFAGEPLARPSGYTAPSPKPLLSRTPRETGFTSSCRVPERSIGSYHSIVPESVRRPRESEGMT